MNRDLSLDQASDGLKFIDASCRDTWVKVAFALKSEYGELAEDVFMDWSSTAANFCPKAARHTWRSAKAGAVGIGTLIYIAKQTGWQLKSPLQQPDPLALAQRKEAQRLALAKQLEADKQARTLAKQQANSRWQQAKPASPNHQYLLDKMVLPYGIRQEGNLLLIPICCNKELVNLQTIDPKGNKRFIKGGQVKGAFSLIGDASKLNQSFYIAEGWATAASLHEFTYKPVLVAFNEGNLVSVAIAARQHYPHAQIVMGADNDLNHVSGQNIGLVKAQEGALAIRGQVQLPPDDWNDWNDYATAYKQNAKVVTHA